MARSSFLTAHYTKWGRWREGGWRWKCCWDAEETVIQAAEREGLTHMSAHTRTLRDTEREVGTQDSTHQPLHQGWPEHGGLARPSGPWVTQPATGSQRKPTEADGWWSRCRGLTAAGSGLARVKVVTGVAQGGHTEAVSSLPTRQSLSESPRTNISEAETHTDLTRPWHWPTPGAGAEAPPLLSQWLLNKKQMYSCDLKLRLAGLWIGLLWWLEIQISPILSLNWHKYSNNTQLIHV